jgi:hypothetical protein
MIEVRYIERTSLEKEPLKKTIQKFAKVLKQDILVVFDLRIKGFGSHTWDGEDRRHIIRVSPIRCKFHQDESKGEEVRLGPAAEKYRLVSTILHEIRHAQQKEKLGYKFYHEHYETVEEITNPHVSTWFSECERDARIYEDKNIEDAIDFYDSCLAKE